MNFHKMTLYSFFFVSIMFAQEVPKVNWVIKNNNPNLYLSSSWTDKKEIIYLNITTQEGTGNYWIEKRNWNSELLDTISYTHIPRNVLILFDEEGNYYERRNGIRKMSPQKRLLWEINPSIEGISSFYYTHVQPNGYVVLGGNEYQNTTLLNKYDSTGNFIWESILGSVGNIEDILTDKNENIYVKSVIIKQNVEIPPTYKYNYTKLNTNGKIAWQIINDQSLGTRFVLLDKHNNLTLPGISKIDTLGNIFWKSSIILHPNSISFDSENNIIAAGTTNQKTYTTKIDQSGKIVWYKEYPTTIAFAIKCWIDDKDFSYSLINDMIIKLDKNGNEVWRYTLSEHELGKLTLFDAYQLKESIVLSGNLSKNNKWDGYFVISISNAVATVIEKLDNLPTDFFLSQNYPNPFNPETNISYSIPKAEFVTLKVYDVLGREVATLVNESKQPGVYNSAFSTLRSSLTSGVYFYTLKTGTYAETKKMILAK